jgi:hypothetical protein
MCQGEGDPRIRSRPGGSFFRGTAVFSELKSIPDQPRERAPAASPPMSGRGTARRPLGTATVLEVDCQATFPCGRPTSPYRQAENPRASQQSNCRRRPNAASSVKTRLRFSAGWWTRPAMLERHPKKGQPVHNRDGGVAGPQRRRDRTSQGNVQGNERGRKQPFSDFR